VTRKKERGNGTGTVYPRKNKQGKIIGYRGSPFAPDGKRRYVSAKNKGDAERALRQAMTDSDRGLVFDAGTVKVEDYLNRCLTDSVKDTVRGTTFERYEQITRKHIVPEVGRVKFKDLTPAHVRGLYKTKLEAGLSPRTVQYIHVTLHKALKQAVQDGLIPRNATEAVKPPQLRRGDAPVDAAAGQNVARCGAPRSHGSPLRFGRHHRAEAGRAVRAQVGGCGPGRRDVTGQAHLDYGERRPCTRCPQDQG